MRTYIKIKSKEKYAEHICSYVMIILCLVGLYSCSQEYDLYSGDKFLQFGPNDLSKLNNSSEVLTDTTKTFSFVYEGANVIRSVVYFNLYALGGQENYDRPFIIEQEEVPDTLNAVPGVHYLAFDDPSVASLYSIKAGKINCYVPVVLLRDPSMQSNTYVLKFKLVANEHFITGDTRLLWRKLYMSDELVKPDEWRGYLEKYRFGKYSKVKHRFFIDQTGERWDDLFLKNISLDFALLGYWGDKTKQLLFDYNKAHPDAPLTDEYGDLVTVP
ncbi:MAG: DUF4843 domain-containing protein [Bacteroidales bacterium]